MRIPAWNSFHETHESRKLKNLRYLNIPNKHDGEGYAAIMAHPRGVEIFGAWILILQVSSKCKDRGILRRDDGTPVDSAGLAAKTRAPREVFDLAIPFLCSIGWLEMEPGESAGILPKSPGTRRNLPDRGEGRGGERSEEEGSGLKEREARPRFQAPTIPEIQSYAALLGVPDYSAKFFDYYESKGWKVGKNPMVSWQAAYRGWVSRQGDFVPAPRKPSNLPSLVPVGVDPVKHFLGDLKENGK